MWLWKTPRFRFRSNGRDQECLGVARGLGDAGSIARIGEPWRKVVMSSPPLRVAARHAQLREIDRSTLLGPRLA
jgi:hypothetical protein